ncbi:(2Fe-2S)-binding protein [Zhengella mangrovi]|uniref:(2Fe-2S)-binding protein n=1 Tax=Zhengella mangrovi TaxID=1982044 RepID=A0A2G1QH93_9HYPH|nr:2Fe-2S iron-sulfur cluster-binding protein [Zhengella mangrovi]PHP64839.1 (2Fe-2S)-binding protein [Zhengella mangrovi]
MTRIIFRDRNGRDHAADAKPGETVMQAAVNEMVSGIVADCGGAGTCATCHGYVDPKWADRVPPPTPDESEMIEAGCFDVEPTSRLTCQITVTEDMDGLIVRLPPSQGL